MYSSCSGNTGKFKSVFKYCNSGKLRNEVLCGDNDVKLINSESDLTTFNISGFAYGQSCTYKVFSKCSWPKFEVDSKDVSLFFATFKGSVGDNLDNDDAQTLSSGQIIGNNTVAVPNKADQVHDCKTQVRMYVTIARLNQSSLAQEEAR